jgi:phosphatidylserine/phosphatidylglycerophosphate/cardiolipin synthase-like enzyme
MSKIHIGVLNSKAELIRDDQYHQIVKYLCLRARRRIFANVFIIDLLPSEETIETVVADLLLDVRDARLRGVDIRLIIGGSKQNADIQDKTEAALKHCQRLKIPCQLMSLFSESTSHKKLVVVDDRVLIGSHNWSHGAFTGQIQDSVLIEDDRLASYFADEIANEWRELSKEVRNVSV